MSKATFMSTIHIYDQRMEQIAAWLIETTDACNSEAPPPYSKPAGQPSSMRLKGKARKEAKKLKDAANSEVPMTADKKASVFKIKVDQFPELASKIMGSRGDAYKVPDVILKMAQDVLELRQEYDLFIDGGPSADADQKPRVGDRCFSIIKDMVRVLKRDTEEPVSKVPVGVYSNPQTGNMERQSSNNELEDLARILACLHSSTAPPGPNTVIASFTPRKPSHPSRFLTDPGLFRDSVYLGLYCLFKDINSIRLSVRDIWTNYTLGQNTLVHASIMTHHAIGIVKCMEENFLGNHPFIPDGETVIRLFQAIALMDRNKNPVVDKERNALAEHGHDDHDVKIDRWCYFPIVNVLRAFCEFIQPGKPRHVTLEALKGSEHHADGRAKIAKDIRIEDIAILLEALNDCVVLSTRVAQSDQDSITASVREMCVTKRVTLELCFASQVHLDMSHVVGDNKGQGFLSLHDFGTEAKECLTKALSFPPSSRNWPVGFHESLEEMISYINRIIVVDVFTTLEEEAYAPNCARPAKNESFGLLRRNPFLCGTQSKHIARGMHNVGKTLALNSGSILFVAHLYNALRQTLHLEIEWPPLELCISALTCDRLFGGDAPKTLQQCSDICMAILKERVGAFVCSEAWRKRPRPHGLERVTRYWAARPWSPKVGKENPTVPSSSVDAELPGRTWRLWETTRPPNPLELMDLLEVDTREECRILSYNFVGIHFICLDLLRKLRSALHDTLVPYISEEYIKQEDQLPLIAGYIVAVAGKSSDGIGKMAGGQGKESILGRAGDVMKDFIEMDSQHNTVPYLQRFGICPTTV